MTSLQIDKLMKKILKDTFTALSVKIDYSVKDLSINLQICEQQLVI